MRVFKALLVMMPLKLIWVRITSSKITTTFFIIALVHCLVQVALEISAYSLNARAYDLLRTVVNAGDPSVLSDNSIAIYGDKNLTICNGVPGDSACQVVWHQQNVDADTLGHPPVNVASTASSNVPDTSVTPLVPPPASSTSTAVSSQLDAPSPSVVSPASATATRSSVPARQAATSISTSTFTSSDVVKSASPPVILSSVSVVSSSGTTTVGSLSRSTATPAPSSTAVKVVIISQPQPDTDGDDSGEDDEDADDDTSIRRVAGNGLVRRESVVRLTDDYGKVLGVQILGADADDSDLVVNQTCILTLQVPMQSLRQSFRVDFTFIAFQVWVLGMSIVALLNESVPHIIASFMTHVLATAWSGYQLQLTEAFRGEFNALVTNGPCHANLLSTYWAPRRNTEISILVLNLAVMIAIGVLSYKLLKSFGWQTFKKIGASFVINHCYRLVLGFSIVVQLSVFFIGANIALWLDQLYNGTFGRFGPHRHIFQALDIIFLVALFPWLAIGWFSVRRESRAWMAVFLGVSVVLTGCWAGMFSDRAFLWTFRTWDFFAVITCACAVLLAATMALGVVCRLNFGKGLPAYLSQFELGTTEPAWEPSDEKDRFGDEEKLVNFPSSNGESPIPTFSAAFGGPEGLERLRTMSRPSTLASRPGISMHARGTSTSGSMDFVGLPTRPNIAVTVSRSVSSSSRSTISTPVDQPILAHNDTQRLALARINTSESQRSYSSQNSGSSATRVQRWAIE